ncbi:MAG: arginine--tRNA ligase, partial [Bacilli bacterium]|nr:arginine--tRNA ligase [Bacilli bacterium]
MLIEEVLKSKIQLALKEIGVELELNQIVIERSKEKVHGDYATNVAMQLARTLRKAPLMIANDLVAHLNQEGFEKVEVVNPGFINFFLKAEAVSSIVSTIINEGDKYGTQTYGQGQKINVEFVSANPTGDLHLGHARGAAIGDCIC